jgi:hypothetical protein
MALSSAVVAVVRRISLDGDSRRSNDKTTMMIVLATIDMAGILHVWTIFPTMSATMDDDKDHKSQNNNN